MGKLVRKGSVVEKKGVAYGKIILKARREKVHLNNGKSLHKSHLMDTLYGIIIVMIKETIKTTKEDKFMGEVRTDFSISMSTKTDYELVEIIIKNLFDAEPCQEVVYDKENLWITVDDWLADMDDVVELAKVVRNQLLEVAGEDDRRREICEKVSYDIEGITLYYNCGEMVKFNIEKKDKKIIVRQTDNFREVDWSQFEDYEEFCEELGDYVREYVSEDFFNNHRYGYCTCTDTDVYVYDTPDYGKPYDIEEHKETGKVYSLNDTIIEYLKENNLPYDDKTIEELSVDDVYDIIGGTYGKNSDKE